MVNVALPTMAHEFGVPTTDVEWIAVGYLLALRRGDPGRRLDRRPVRHQAGVRRSRWRCSSRCRCCAAPRSRSTSSSCFRVLQGVGGGMLTPIGGGDALPGLPDRRAGQGGDRRAQRGGAGAGDRPDARRDPRRRGVVAVDLPNQRARSVSSRSCCRCVWLREETQPNPGRFDVAGLVLSAAGVSILLYTLSIGPHEGWISAEDAGVRVRRCGVHRRADRRRAADRAIRSSRCACCATGCFRTINIAVVDDVRRVLRRDLRPAALPAEPARLQRVRERPRPVAAGDRHLPRVEPARPPAVSGDRTAAADGRRHRAHRDRSPAATRSPGSTPRCRRSPVCRSAAASPSGLVFVSIQTAAYGTTSVVDTGPGDVDVQHATSDRLRRRRRRGGDGDRVEARRGRRRLRVGRRAARRLPGRLPRRRPDHGCRRRSCRGSSTTTTSPRPAASCRRGPSRYRSSESSRVIALVVGAEVADEHARDRLDVERAGSLPSPRGRPSPSCGRRTP